ncbi:MAG: ComF family protein [Chloroflexi bacterium]|nr:ComF family protein [Chloroflexota bacterium]
MLVDFVFPLRCVGCGAWDTLLCDRCRAGLPAIIPPCCPRCGVSQPDGPVGVCATCLRTPLNFLDGVWSGYRFEGVIREAVHDLKYQGISALAEPLGTLLGGHVRERFPEATVLVPVPLHPSRLRERGYNQAALLARAVGQVAGLPVWAEALRRVRPTPSQTTLNALGRRQNVRGAFTCAAPAIAGQRVVLVDDVTTTVATLDACAAALKAAGVRSVWGCALARGG